MNFSHDSDPDYWARVYNHGSIHQMITDESTNDQESETSTRRTFHMNDDYYDQ